MAQQNFTSKFAQLIQEAPDRALTAKRIAEDIACERGYRWVGLYEVTPKEIGMIACTGATPPAFPRFPVTKGLCGSAVATRSVVNVGNVQEDPRWLTTFGSTRSEIIVPIFSADESRVIGLIDVESESVNAFTANDERFLNSCAPFLQALFS
jgi:L-methionine (R)-S-oxide reductase